MSKRKSIHAIKIQTGSGNVYADIGVPDADAMLIKAQLMTKIAELIKRKGLTQTQAGHLLGLPQSVRALERKLPWDLGTSFTGLPHSTWT